MGVTRRPQALQPPHQNERSLSQNLPRGHSPSPDSQTRSQHTGWRCWISGEFAN